MSGPLHERDPCPDRITDDAGGAFAMGAGIGTIINYVKGARSSEGGRRMIGGFRSVRLNAPAMAGSFAVWGGLFSTVDCTMVYLRQKEDPWNSIMAGACTGGFLRLRKGLRVSRMDFLFGGCLLAMIEGVIIVATKFAPNQQEQRVLEEQRAVEEALGGVGGYRENQLDKNLDSFLTHSPPIEQTNSKVDWFSSWLGGLFGSRKKEGKAEAFDSFDIPAPPLPIFDY